MLKYQKDMIYIRYLSCSLDLQSWKSGWYTLSDLGEKETPFPPTQCWSESCCQQPCQIPQHWFDGGWEGLWRKWEPLCFLLNKAQFSTSVVSMGIFVINCIYFFPGLKLMFKKKIANIYLKNTCVCACVGVSSYTVSREIYTILVF